MDKKRETDPLHLGRRSGKRFRRVGWQRAGEEQDEEQPVGQTGQHGGGISSAPILEHAGHDDHRHVEK